MSNLWSVGNGIDECDVMRSWRWEIVRMELGRDTGVLGDTTRVYEIGGAGISRSTRYDLIIDVLLADT